MGDRIVSERPAAPSSPQAAAFAREPIDDTIREGERFRGAGVGRQDEIKDRGARVDRVLSEGILSKIDTIVKREAPKEPEFQTETATEEKSAETAVEGKPAPAAPAEPDWKADRDRLEAANRQLMAELEAARKQPPAVAPTHDKMLQEAYDSYGQDSISSVRRFLAASMGIEDPADSRVDAEIKDLYTDLTSAVLGVKTDDAHLAKREAARALLLMAREKRERKADEAKAAERAEAEAKTQKAAEAARFIGNRLTTKQSDGKSIGDSYPLLQQFAERLDGMKPEALIWEVLQRETKTGRIAPAQDDDASIHAAAKLIETHYQDLAERIGKARPQTQSTAQPSQPQATSSSKETRQETPARTLTTADASVAPATPPATKTEAPKDKPPSWKDTKARQEWALRRIPR